MPLYGPDSYPLKGWTANTYILPAHLNGATSSAVSTSARQTWLPFTIDRRMTIVALGLYLTTAQAGAECRLGLYTNFNSKPTNLVVDAGIISLASGGGAVKETSAISTTIEPGTYWTCCNMKNVATQATVLRVSGAAGSWFCDPNLASLGAGTVNRYYLSDSFTYGSSLSANAPAMTPNAGSDAPIIALKVST